MIIILLCTCVFIIVELFCRMRRKSLLEILHPDWFHDVTRFPDLAFKCRTDCSNYRMRVAQGYEKMKNTTIVFTGLCINIAPKVESLIKRMEHMGSFFKDYRVVIFENDSSDGTRDLLKRWTLTNPKVHLVPCQENPECKLKAKPAVHAGAFSSSRMEKMTDYRNRSLDYVRRHFSHFDCLGVIDLDIHGPISMDGLANSFGYWDSWDTISAFGMNGITLSMGRPVYYDLIAYKPYSNDLNINQNKFHIVPIVMQTSKFHVGMHPVKVESGFAGMALYKMSIINTGVDYTPIDGHYQCEHITFNKNIYDAGFQNIYMNPSMLILVGPQGDVDKYPFY